MQPLKQPATIPTLDLTSSFTNGDWTLPRDAQALLFFLKEDVDKQSQGPTPQDSRSAHQLIVIQAQFFFAIPEANLDDPTCRDMHDQGFGVRLQLTGGPVAGLRERGVQGVPYNHDLAAIELAHTGGHD